MTSACEKADDGQRRGQVGYEPVLADHVGHRRGFRSRELERGERAVDPDQVRPPKPHGDAAVRIAGATVKMDDLRVVAVDQHLERQVAE
jgi:hypothetical protein